MHPCRHIAQWDGTTWSPLGLANGVGTAHSQLASAPSPALIGGTFYQQTIPLEFDGEGAMVAVRGSNALLATIGTL